MKDVDPRVRAAAVRICEPLLRENHPVISKAIEEAALDPEQSVVEQACMSLYYVHAPGAEQTANSAIATKDKTNKKQNNVKLVVNKYREEIARRAAEAERQRHLEMTNPVLAAMVAKGRAYYGQTCVACHAPSGLGTNSPEHNGTTLAPPLKGSARLQGDKSICLRIVLHGLTGVNNGKTFPGQMASFKMLDDVWLASILSYARNEWGNSADIILPEDVARMRRLTEDHDKPYMTDDIPSPQPRVVMMESVTVRPKTTQLSDAATVMTASVPVPGTYAVLARATTAMGTARFAVEVAGQSMVGTVSASDSAEVPVGIVHLDSPGKVEVGVRAIVGARVDLSSIRLERRY